MESAFEACRSVTVRLIDLIEDTQVPETVQVHHWEIFRLVSRLTSGCRPSSSRVRSRSDVPCILHRSTTSRQRKRIEMPRHTGEMKEKKLYTNNRDDQRDSNVTCLALRALTFTDGSISVPDLEQANLAIGAWGVEISTSPREKPHLGVFFPRLPTRLKVVVKSLSLVGLTREKVQCIFGVLYVRGRLQFEVSTTCYADRCVSVASTNLESDLCEANFQFKFCLIHCSYCR